MWTIPTRFTVEVREFGTGALFAMLVVSTLFFGFYLTRTWHELSDMRLRVRTRIFYSDVNRAAIGWFTASLGATIKNGAALVVLHAQASQHHEVSALVPVFYIAGMLLALWGMVCLMHALTRGSWYRGQWTAMIAGALVFAALWTWWL